MNFSDFICVELGHNGDFYVVAVVSLSDLYDIIQSVKADNKLIHMQNFQGYGVFVIAWEKTYNEKYVSIVVRDYLSQLPLDMSKIAKFDALVRFLDN